MSGSGRTFGVRRTVNRARSRTIIWVTAIALVAGLAAFFTRPEGLAATDVKRSFFRTTPDGVAALARGIARLGRPTAPRITPLADAEPVPGAIVLLSPQVVPSPAEVHALLERVRVGGTLVYAPLLVPTVFGTLRVTPLMDSLGIAFRLPQEGDLDDPQWAPHALTEGLPAPDPPRRVLRRLTERGLVARRDAERGDIQGRGGHVGSVGSPLEDLLTTGPSEDRRWIGAGLTPLGDGRCTTCSPPPSWPSCAQGFVSGRR